jgi:hypothetical protein
MVGLAQDTRRATYEGTWTSVAAGVVVAGAIAAARA